jgi:transcriptional regulator with XRE-family HTH domain
MDKPIAKRLKEFRMARGFSQQEAGDLSNVRQTDISRMESGTAKFLNDTYIQFLNKEGCNLGWLFSGEGEMIAKEQQHPTSLIENRLEKQIAIMYKRILANEERLLQVEQLCHEQRTKQV